MTDEQRRTLAYFQSRYERWRNRSMRTAMSTADWYLFDRAKAEYFGYLHWLRSVTERKAA